MRKFVIVFIGLILIVSNVKADDTTLYVCRDPRFATVRLEFHNIPQSWFTWGSDVSWGYWAEGVAMYPDAGVMVADALEHDTDGYLAGTALIVSGDLQWVGDANSPLCDVTLSPIQWDGAEIILTPAPTRSICAAEAIDSGTGRMYCYTPTANGVVPLPAPTG